MSIKDSHKGLEGIWKLEKYGKFEANKWTEISSESENLFLILKNMQLMLVHNNTLLDSISLLNDFVRIAFKNDSLGIAIRHQPDAMRKIRFKFASCGIHSGAIMGSQCTNTLKKITKIHDVTIGTEPNEENRVPISRVISDILKKDVSTFASECENDCDLSLEDIILTSILDSEFPRFIAKVNSIVQKLQSNG